MSGELFSEQRPGGPVVFPDVVAHESGRNRALVRPGLEGWLGGKAGLPERGLYLAAALTLIHPGLTTDLIGAILLGAGLCLQRLRRKHRSAPVSENL